MKWSKNLRRSAVLLFVGNVLVWPLDAMAVQLGPLQIFSAQNQPFNSLLLIDAQDSGEEVLSLEVLAVECPSLPAGGACPTVVVDEAAGASQLSNRLIRRIVSEAPVTVPSFSIRLRLVGSRGAQVRSYAIYLDSQAILAPQRALVDEMRTRMPLPSTEVPMLAPQQAQAGTPTAAAPAMGPAMEPAMESELVEKRMAPIQKNEGGRHALPNEVQDLLRRWVAAWEGKDVGAYFDCYSPRFRPINGGGVDEWVAERRRKIMAAARISVRVSAPVLLEVNGSEAVLEFLQHYRSNSFESVVRKKLILEQVDGLWRILEEQIVPARSGNIVSAMPPGGGAQDALQ